MSTDVVFRSLTPVVDSGPRIREQAEWSASLRIAFRFVFVYLVLYNFPFPIGFLPYTNYPAQEYVDLWHKIVPWVGRHVLHLAKPITVFSNGSSDTTFDYVLVLCYLVLAAAATAIWTVAGRRHLQHRRLSQWLRLYVRLTLGGTMIIYGAYKVIPTQFPAPSLAKLLEPYGQASPMGLLWTFMGASVAYSFFAGACEMLGGILVIIPGLTTLGALILAGVLSNVFMLNMCYDVPVKLYSFHLLLMAIFLAAPDLGRLGDVFILHRPSSTAVEPPLFTRKRLNQGAVAAQLLLGLLIMGVALHQSLQAAGQQGFRSPRPPLYGIWSIEQFALNGTSHPPLLTDDVRWQRAIFESPEVLTVQQMDGTLHYYSLNIDPARKTITLGKGDDKKWVADLKFAQPQSSELIIDGRMDGQPLHVEARLGDEKEELLLPSRGFHWINEYPFNR
jgi:uncharacterized membrane protein YphA (DoxX/SURF4 family)